MSALLTGACGADGSGMRPEGGGVVTLWGGSGMQPEAGSPDATDADAFDNRQESCSSSRMLMYAHVC